MANKKTSLVILGYADGSYEYAVGDHAEEVASYINAAQAMQYIHGGMYNGKQMIAVPAPGEGELEPIKPIAERTFPEWVEELRSSGGVG